MIDPLGIPKRSVALAARCDQMAQAANLDAAIRRCCTDLTEAYISGMKAYAWWQDGVEMVGTCGTTFKDAAERVRREAGSVRGAGDARESLSVLALG